MATRKSKKLDTFEGLYKRLEEVILANSGENEFEEIFKLVVLKLWNELNDEPVELTMDKANLKLRKIDLLWGGSYLNQDFYYVRSIIKYAYQY